MTGKYGLILVLLSYLISACSGQAQAGALGNPEKGKTLFHQTAIREAPACSTCHTSESGEVIVGPSLANVASRASERKPGLSAEEYIRESILDPNAYVVEGFSEGLMYQNYRDTLTEEEINDLISYLLTLEQVP
jgi:sulfur-oxidizing protein SoxX